MNILFMYDSPLVPEKGGTERATWLVMQELERRGYHCMGFLHFNQDNPDEYFYNGERIPSLIDFLQKHQIDVVVNQIAFHYWLLKEFLAHGGQQWKNEGGKIISFMHFDPTSDKQFQLRDLFRGFKKKSAWAKIKRIGLILYLPILRYRITKTERMSYRYVYNNSEVYVVMSPSYIKSFSRIAKLIDVNKMYVITNMLTFPNIVKTDILFQKENIVLVVARLDEKQKRLSIILKIWHSLDIKDWKLQIIGTGEDEAFYQEMIRKYSIPNVELLGHRSPLEYYQKAKIFLMSSPREGWGLTITESMQNGTVPIVLDTSTVFHDILSDKIDGYLPKTSKQMKRSLYRLMNDDKLRSRMAIAALKKAECFSRLRVGNEWEKMLENIYGINMA